MILNDKALSLLRASAHECEKAIGTEYADVYSAKHIATLETILELAEDPNVGEVTISVAEPTDLDEPVEEMDDDPPRRKRMDVDHDEIRKMLSEGVTVNEISERTGVGISTIYKIKKMQRDMEAK